MNLDAILASYDEEVRQAESIADPAIRVEWDGPVRRMTGPDATAWNNAVLYSGLGADDADAAIARQVEHFGALGHAFEWKLHDHDRPANLAERLRAAGFVAEPVETLVVFDVGQAFRRRPTADGVEFARLEDPATFDAIVDASASAHGDREHAEWLVASLRAEKSANPDALSVHVARAAGTVVAVGWVRLPDSRSFASLWAGGTRPEWRRRGIYTGLVAERLADARERGYRWVTVDCSAQSLPILKRRGFRPLARITPWIHGA